MSLFSELKRRNVFRVTVAYLVAAWLLVQVADILLEAVGAPDVVLKTLLILLALGVVPAVVFSWVYEMTPEGVKKASEIDQQQSITHETGKKLDIAVIVMLVLVVGLVVADRIVPDSEDSVGIAPLRTSAPGLAEETGTDAAVPQGENAAPTSIAVLPFANRSNQQDDLYFTDGIHDDLLTQLAKIHGLTVISRTSVMEYRDSPKNLREIGAELNVGAILEGGVQKVGDRVRINAQLIEAATDRHLWAETFDRELTAENVFELQSEIARKIVQAIAVQLTPEEERLLDQVPTQSLAAYDLYLRARDVIFGANYTRDQEAAAQPLLERALELDPGYVDAHVALAGIYAQTYWRGVDTSDEFLAKYRQTLNRAIELDPGSPEALRAQANYAYRVENDYTRSLELLDRALASAPGNVDLHGDRGLTLRRLGRWDESIASFRRGLELDPANAFYRGVMLETMANARRWQDILDNSVRLEDADPDQFDAHVMRAVAQFNLTGDLEPLDRVFEEMNQVPSSHYMEWSVFRHLLRRDAERALRELETANWDRLRDQPLGAILYWSQRADALRLAGELSEARRAYERVTQDRDEIMASSLQTRVYGGTVVAAALARLGRHDEALELANRLVADHPPEADALIAGTPIIFRAQVRGLAGDVDGAIEDLEATAALMSASIYTPRVLQFDPNWDFLREDARFAALASSQPTQR